MKKLTACIFCVLVFVTCRKGNEQREESQINKTVIVVQPQGLHESLIFVDSSKLVFKANGRGVDSIKVGTILVSDISDKAPLGFLRKVTGIVVTGGDKEFITEQASLTDVIVHGSASYSRTFTDADIVLTDSSGLDISAVQRGTSSSFNFAYEKVLFDKDGNSATQQDQVIVKGEYSFEPLFDFDIDIKQATVKKLVVKLTLKNTNKITAEAKSSVNTVNQEIVLKTFELKPFTIFVAGIPVPIAKQWIAIVLGLDGSLTAKITASATNTNTATAGIAYENGTWSNISGTSNNFSYQLPTIEGSAKVEPWLQARYEIRPYGLKQSRIFAGVKGSLIAELAANNSGLTSSLKWGLKLNAKAQVTVIDKTIIDYEQLFYNKQFDIYSTTLGAPTLNTLNVSAVGQTSASSGGNTIKDGGLPITAKGVCWSTNTNPTINNSKTLNGTGSGDFTSNMVGLNAGTNYYVRAYATNAGGTGYGNQISFTTTASSTVSLATLTTSSVSNITSTTAQCGGNISSDGGGAVVARGVCWSTSVTPTINDNKTTNGSGTGSFTSQLSGLNPGTTYYVRSYATNSAGTAYGNSVSFNTTGSTSSLPTVNTNNVTGINATSASGGGTVLSDGGSSVTARGICWSSSGTPTIANSKTTDGTGLGSFTSSITGLTSNTSYSVRAYATNSAGTAYGNTVNFSTTTSPGFVCGNSFTVTHSAGSVAPVTKTVTYGTVSTNISGSTKCWITQNLGASQQASSAVNTSEAAAGWYWQFNRAQGYKHDGTTRTPSTWNFTNSSNSNWTAANDPCTLLLGSGWRIPTKTEWSNANTWSNYNQAYNSVLKLHTSGIIKVTGEVDLKGSGGFFWSSTQNTSTNAWQLWITTGSGVSFDVKGYGYPLRCIKD